MFDGMLQRPEKSDSGDEKDSTDGKFKKTSLHVDVFAISKLVIAVKSDSGDANDSSGS